MSKLKNDVIEDDEHENEINKLYNILVLQSSVIKPAAHPPAHVPLTWLHGLFSKQFPQVSLQFWPNLSVSQARQGLQRDWSLMDDYNINKK